MILKPKVYMDTSVISHLLAYDTPEKRIDTLKLWEQLKENEYEIVISTVVYEELSRCEEDLFNQLMSFFSKLKITNVEESEQTIFLADEYLATRVLTPKNRDDCRHIAIACISNCKYILSWNMKHFVKLKTIEMVYKVNERLGVFQPMILTPSIFIQGDEENE